MEEKKYERGTYGHNLLSALTDALEMYDKVLEMDEHKADPDVKETRERIRKEKEKVEKDTSHELHVKVSPDYKENRTQEETNALNYLAVNYPFGASVIKAFVQAFEEMEKGEGK